MKRFSMKKGTTRLAASLVLVSAVLSYLVSDWFLLIAVFVGLNMIQFTYTNWCLAEKIFKFKE